MHAITDDDIRRAVSASTYQAGLQYWAERRVQSLRVDPDGTAIEASVRGNGRRLYVQIISLGHRAGRLTVDGVCSCPVGINCKHVVAVLFQCRGQAGARLVGALPPSVQPGPLPGIHVARPERLHSSVPLSPPRATPALPTDVEAWLRGLDAAHQEESEDYPVTVRKRLLYALDHAPHSGGLLVSLQSIELDRDGKPGGTVKRHQADQLMRGGQQPKFLRPSDRVILKRLALVGIEHDENLLPTLQKMLATGRARWATFDGPVLSEGTPVLAELGWAMAEDGRQRPEFLLPEPLVGLRLAVPWYVDPAKKVMGPVETTLPPRLLGAMMACPALTPEAANRVRNEMSRRWPDSVLPAPRAVDPPQHLHVLLRPHLLLLAGSLPFDPNQVFMPDRQRYLARTALGWRACPGNTGRCACPPPASITASGSPNASYSARACCSKSSATTRPRRRPLNGSAPSASGGSAITTASRTPTRTSAT